MRHTLQLCLMEHHKGHYVPATFHGVQCCQDWDPQAGLKDLWHPQALELLLDAVKLSFVKGSTQY